jgi:hypothetical protein
MATAIPFLFDLPEDELATAIRKLRAKEPLTPREREIVALRGMELGGATDGPPPGADLDDEKLDPDEEQELLERSVLGEVDFQEGRCIPAEKFCADRGIPWPRSPVDALSSRS